MDSEAVVESGKPEKSLVDKILEKYPVLDLDIKEGAKVETGDQFFGIAQPIAKEGKVVEPMRSIIPQDILESHLDKKGTTYGVFELLRKGKIGFVDLKDLPPNISLDSFGFGRYRFRVAGILEEKIEKIGHIFYAGVLSEEKTGVKHTHYKKGVKFLTEVPEKFRKLWLPIRDPATNDVYYVLRGNDEIEQKGVERGDSFNAILTEYKGSGEHDFEIAQFKEFGYMGYAKPEDIHNRHKIETKFNYKMLRAGHVYRFAAVHVMLPREDGLRKFYCVPLQLVKGIDAAYVKHEAKNNKIFK